MTEPLLHVANLAVQFETLRGPVRPVDGIDFSVAAGQTLGIVGESGCGKSMTSLALMGLLPPNGLLTAHDLRLGSQDLLHMPEAERRKVRGAEMAMIFQDPMSSLNPSFTVGQQITETIQAHEGGSASARRSRVLELLTQVGIPAPASRLDAYPHQLSGGMCQRVMIAMAIACRPKLLIADEPTTALDVTIQAQILDLLKRIQRATGMALILITHDIGVVSRMADELLVMYAGQIVEAGPTRELIRAPDHPYTAGLLACLPGTHSDREHRAKLPSIAGFVPDLTRRPAGCQFSPRCSFADDACRAAVPRLEVQDQRQVRCIRPLREGSRS